MLVFALSFLGVSISTEYIKNNVTEVLSNPSLYVFSMGILLVIYIFVSLQSHIFNLYIEKDVNYFLYINSGNCRDLMNKDEIKELYLKMYRRFISRERKFMTNTFFKNLEFCTAELILYHLNFNNKLNAKHIIDRYLKIYNEETWVLDSLYRRVLMNGASVIDVINRPIIRLNKMLIEDYKFYPNIGSTSTLNNIKKKYWTPKMEYDDIMLKMFNVIIIFERNKNEIKI